MWNRSNSDEGNNFDSGSFERTREKSMGPWGLGGLGPQEI